MAKKDDYAGETAPTDEPKHTHALTVGHVKALIEARFIAYEIEHGHLSAEDGAAKLEALKGGA